MEWFYCLVEEKYKVAMELNGCYEDGIYSNLSVLSTFGFQPESTVATCGP